MDTQTGYQLLSKACRGGGDRGDIWAEAEGRGQRGALGMHACAARESNGGVEAAS